MPVSRFPLSDAVLAQQYPHLRAVARRVLHDPRDVEDAVQTALERAWRFRDRFDGSAAAGPWLAAITRRAALDVLRAQRVTAVPIDESYPAAEVTEASVLARESARSLGMAIASLAPAYRSAILMHDVQGLSLHEIAAHESRKYHTVRTHLFRARRALRGKVAGVAA